MNVDYANVPNSVSDVDRNDNFKNPIPNYINSDNRLIKVDNTERNSSLSKLQQNKVPEGPELESITKDYLNFEFTTRALTPNVVIPLKQKIEDEIEKVGRIEPMNMIEILETQPHNCCYYLKYPFVFTRYHLNYYAKLIIENKFFEGFILLLIVANCVILATDDPTTDIQEKWQSTADIIFQVFYTIELVLKVIAMGFLFNKGAYMRDFWNIFDFIIVAFGYLQYLNISNGGFDLRPLRVFRIFRPLRTITSIRGLKILLTALISSLPLLLDAVIILVFFLSIFAIAGLQLWHGILKNRCMNNETKEFDEEAVCGYITCPNGYSCQYFGKSPNFDVTKFDDFFSALMLVFTAVTQEGWTNVEHNMISAFGYVAPVYFNLLIYLGSYFMFNFTLAVINSKVSSLYDKNRKLLNEKAVTVISQSGLKSKVALKGNEMETPAVNGTTEL